MNRLATPLARRVAAAAGGIGAVHSYSQLYRPSPQALAGPPPKSKTIHEVKLSVSADVEAAFADWLPGYLKHLLELPGLNGAKIARPRPEQAEPPASKPVVVFVLGGPGAGKGTQCSKIVEEYKYTHLSAGDLLRAERASGSEQGQMIDEYIKEGKIVPVEVTIRLLVAAIQAQGGNRFLVDGFPRNANNLAGWHRVVGDSLHVAGVLLYDCPEEAMEARLLQRGLTSGRSDDNLESIRKRFRTFEAESRPVLEYYEQMNLVTKIDGSQPVEEVWARSQAAVAAYEQQLASSTAASSAPRIAFHVSVHAVDEAHTPDVAARVAVDAARKWGEGAVLVEGQVFDVKASLKAFDLDALRAFD